MKILPILILLASFPLLSAEPVKQAREDREPEAATGIIKKKSAVGNSFMVTAANPYAVKAGYDIIEQGGSAVDAAIAVQLVLSLVEPQSSGIGGGAFMLHWNNATKKLTSIDGREVAPSRATPEMFLDEHGKKPRWIDAVVGGRSVGVPSILKAMKLAHEQHGKLPWETLFSAAIELSQNGFIVSPRLEKLVTMGFNPGLKSLPVSADYFYPNGQPIKAGMLKKNPQLAHLLQRVAKQGISAFYEGENAQEIVSAVQSSKVAPGLLTLQDLKDYQPKMRDVVCSPYKGNKVCSMGPPSSGGVTILQMLELLAPFKLEQYKPNSLEAVHLITQASRLAFADRNKYLADSDFVHVPVNELLDATYLKQRATLISLNSDMGKAVAGNPVKLARANDDAIERPSTSHLSIIDKEGNVVSMTSSIEMAFGSAVMVNGYLLNNQLTDFSLTPRQNGKLVANAVQAGKRPRSSMTPVIVLDKDNNFKAAIGSPGGSRIINYVTQTLIAYLDWGMDLQAAIDLPKFTNRNRLTTLEKDTDIAGLQSQLEDKGHKISVRNLNSGVHAIVIENNKIIGAADPRREGIAMGK